MIRNLEHSWEERKEVLKLRKFISDGTDKATKRIKDFGLGLNESD